jgi:hypothetical protein
MTVPLRVGFLRHRQNRFEQILSEKSHDLRTDAVADRGQSVVPRRQAKPVGQPHNPRGLSRREKPPLNLPCLDPHPGLSRASARGDAQGAGAAVETAFPHRAPRP